MKIIEVRVNNTMDFEDLDVGEVFNFEDQFYLKIEDYDECGELMNCVCLTDYRLYYMEKCDSIEKVNAKLTIN